MVAVVEVVWCSMSRNDVSGSSSSSSSGGSSIIIISSSSGRANG